MTKFWRELREGEKPDRHAIALGGVILQPHHCGEDQPKPATGEWTAKQSEFSKEWYVEFDAMNGACIDNELTAKGIVNYHNAALASAWRKGHSDAQSPALERIDELRNQLAAEKEKVKDAQEEAFAAYAEADAIREQLAAEREKVQKLTVALSRITLNGDYASAQEARMALGVEP